MAIENVLDLASTIIILSAGAIPAYLSLKLRGDMAAVTAALTVFIVMHGIYHIVRMQGLESMADGMFEPASVAALIAFGTTYLFVSHRKKKRKEAEARGT